MRLDDEQESTNFEDRRGGGGGMPGGARGVGIGTIVIALAASYFFGIDPSTVISVASQMQGGEESRAVSQETRVHQSPASDPQTKFILKVLHTTEQTWSAIFAEQGRQYVPPTLVVFTGRTSTACGTGESAMGPFYCPADSKVYIDLAFYRDLQNRFKAPGDFAQAYVIAHEVGHHVQHLLGISAKVQQARQQATPTQGNALSVKLELQADCLAGVWAARANEAKQILDTGDIEEALTAASAIGDDRLQQQSRGTVAPDSFTHGSSAQRMRWFKRGIDSGDMNQCNTFKTSNL
ncbi:MAG: neutral zinc metallopeptidase [Rhodocyclaceae bacterium]|nr:neutral zinc metallopeptidase [Rhodocyclaceae bacterium]